MVNKLFKNVHNENSKDQGNQMTNLCKITLNCKLYVNIYE